MLAYCTNYKIITYWYGCCFMKLYSKLLSSWLTFSNNLYGWNGMFEVKCDF
jgi:hypothetical protein